MGAREKDLNPDVFIGLKLPLGYSDTGYFKQTKTTMEQAKWNIINLLQTIPGERLGQPTFGSKIHELLFEPMDSDFSETVVESVRESITTWLPYINIKDINVGFPENFPNQVDITVDFGLSFEPNRFGSVSVNFDQFESSIKG